MAATTTLPFMNLDLRRLGLARAAAPVTESISVKDAFSPLHSSRSRGVNFQTAQDNSLINIVTTDDPNAVDVTRMNNSLRRLIQSTSTGAGGATPSIGGDKKQAKALAEKVNGVVEECRR